MPPVKLSNEFQRLKRARDSLSAVATQRGPEGVDHLEVFVVTPPNSSEETAFNVFDPFLQQLLMAAFQFQGLPPDEVGLDLKIDGNDLVGVQLSIGEAVK
jgi:hypothetical protein